MAAATIQVQSWQDISADLQAKCERWEQVNDSSALALRQAKAEVTRLTLERQEAEAKVRRGGGGRRRRWRTQGKGVAGARGEGNSLLERDARAGLNATQATQLTDWC